MNKHDIKETTLDLREEVHKLAEAAFHSHLISGHGDSEYDDEYQIVHEGKPRHMPLVDARSFLTDLLEQTN
ncbi:hypothetical protein JOY44_07700 [Phormidium sp. CLA17]|uniref:hypothetical protein n=1 Tax=Leptolyngbya sp. Cla-17 TaxID=2803751 RepID=UPI0014928C8E|nr:hypothetical protein [Leptolyngbya sp. Cla-17]MBM0741498.1 hypothetical protein [Leptolyngbya sp. Cla-17]